MSDLDELHGQLFAVVHADPPWNFKTWSKKNQTRAAENHYQTMGLDEIKALPIRDISAEDCALFLWAVNPMLPQALDVIDAWGFSFKTVAFTWAKRTPKDVAWHFGLGYYVRQNTEMCLLATRGKPKRVGRDVAQLIVSPRREHSRKPDEALSRIERLFDGPRLDMFARQTKDGWVSWGNETKKFGTQPSLF